MEGLPLHQNSLGWLVESGISGLYASMRSLVHVPSIQQKVPTAFPASNEEEQDECLQDIVGTNMSFSQIHFWVEKFSYGGILYITYIQFPCRNHLQKIIPLSSAGKSLLFIRFGGFGRCRSSQLWLPSSTTAAGEHGNPNPTEPSWFSALGLVNPKNGGSEVFFCDDTILSGFSPLYSY